MPNVPFHEAYGCVPIPRFHYSYPDHAIPPKNGPSCPLTAIISYIKGTAIDTPDIQRALIRPIYGERLEDRLAWIR